MRRPGYEKWRQWLILPHIIIGIFFFFGMMINIWQVVLYTYSSEQTVAEITDRDIRYKNTRDGLRNEYSLSYRFLINEQTYTRRQVVPEDIYKRYSASSGLSVTYVKSAPHQSTITDNNQVFGNTLHIVFLGLFWNGGVLITVYKNRQIFKQRDKLRQHGKLILGELVRSVRTKWFLELTVYFEIPGADEYITEKRMYVLKKGVLTDLPNDGTTVAIFYLDQKTWEVL